MNETKSAIGYDPMLRIGMFLILGTLLVAATSSGPSVKIGVVDSKQVAAASKSIRGMINDAASKAQELRGELEKKKAEVSDRMEAYSRQKSVVSDEEKKKREQAIQQLMDESEVLEFRLGRELKKSQESMAGPMSLKVRAAIGEVSKEMSLTLVVTSQDLIHYDASYDITAKVIEKLDN